MLALKKKREAEAKAAAEEAERAKAEAANGNGAGPEAPEKVSLLGIGGKKKTKNGEKAGGKKRSPGEIRIQKGNFRIPAFLKIRIQKERHWNETILSSLC